MWGKLVFFLLGAAGAPLVKSALRETIRGGMILGKQVQKLSGEIREDLEDLNADAAQKVAAAGGDAAPASNGTAKSSTKSQEAKRS
jgi:hypothetical protein